MQCKILKTLDYRAEFDSVSDLFNYKIMTVYDLHIFERFKTITGSIDNPIPNP